MAKPIVSEYIVDSWGVLEWLQGREPALTPMRLLFAQADRGEARLWMSRINYGEILYSAHRIFGGASLAEIRVKMGALPLDLVSVDDALIDEACEIKMRFPLSCADCFAAALCLRTSAALVTGDKEFRALERAGILKLFWVGA